MPRKLSRTTLEVLGTFCEDPTTPRHGYDLIKATGIQAGSMYPILQRLEDEGWVDASWEAAIEPSIEGRPRRRYYTITGLGISTYQAERPTMLRRMGGLAPGLAR